ncbi:hypothetical protein [Grapevine badna FI virus]|nr:hypothetical protein [Grapevine badna FI virus]UYM51560.1 hypothetical protein [Grapevine badna FI virus]UYM51564.1 hypothetical protein [Grapevine badna FI virus]UYM51568.1 hypothetical protein [Grapevine badna FI virus]UYM51572.1 hypothetical protein [Grapevine badna FI virus]
MPEYSRLKAQLRRIESLAIVRALNGLNELRSIHAVKLYECRKSSSPGRDGNYWSDHLPSCQHHDKELEELLNKLEKVAREVQRFSL